MNILKKRKNLYIFFLSITAIFTYCLDMTDTHILPKWLYTVGTVAVMGITEGIAILFKKKENTCEKPLLAIVALFCTCQAIYYIVQALGLYPSRFSYQAVGSFDNPAGLVACLCVGIPCCIYLFRVSEQRITKWAIVVMDVVISVAIVLSESRVGMLAGIFVPAGWWVLRTVKKRWLKAMVVVMGIAILYAMYIVKKDSADGRLLIWCSGWEMIKDSPLFGHGIGSIEAHYMNYQAEWLSQHPDSSFSLLADNVKSVFNEYLAIGIRFGVIGWLVLSGFISLMVHCYRKTPSEEGMCALMSLSAIGTLAFFSYPLTYPFTWVILSLDSYILLHRAYSLSILKSKTIHMAITSLLLVLSVFLFYGVIKRIYGELEWKKIANKANKGEDVFSDYKSLLPILGNEPYFLYNYAVELYMAGHDEKSLLVARQCRKFWADYDLELLQGELLDKLNKPQEAEHHYLLASWMCPVRFVPLYKLYELYKKEGDEPKAQQIGESILNKPIKVKSTMIRHIKELVRKDFNLYTNSPIYKSDSNNM